jgi:hypothetical protein
VSISEKRVKRTRSKWRSWQKNLTRVHVCLLRSGMRTLTSLFMYIVTTHAHVLLDAEPKTVAVTPHRGFEAKPPPLDPQHVPNLVKAATELGITNAVQVRLFWRLWVSVECCGSFSASCNIAACAYRDMRCGESTWNSNRSASSCSGTFDSFARAVALFWYVFSEN